MNQRSVGMLGFQSGGLVPVALERGEQVIAPGNKQVTANALALNSMFPRFGYQEGGEVGVKEKGHKVERKENGAPSEDNVGFTGLSRSEYNKQEPQKLQGGGMASFREDNAENQKLQVEFKEKEKKKPKENPNPKKDGKVFLHWAGSGYTGASPSYHATVQGDGSIVKTGDYNTFGRAHTHGRNSEGVGLSLAAMGGPGVNEHNFGKYPVKDVQYENMAKLTAKILYGWGQGPSYVTPQNVMTHAEAGRQDGYGPGSGDPETRWDMWHLKQGGTPWSGGPELRSKVRGYLGGDPNDLSLETTQSIDGGSDATTSSKTKSTSPLQALTSGLDGFGEIGKVISGMLGSLSSMFSDAGLGGIFGSIFGGNKNKEDTKVTDSGTSPSSNNIAPALGGDGAASVGDPNAKALLNAIADAEGTSGMPNKGYNTHFGNGQTEDLSQHPRKKVTKGGHSSDAFGRYQFLSPTWDGVMGGSMEPERQDKAALKLVQGRNVDLSDGLSKKEVYKLGGEWASVEGGPQMKKGGSYGSQAKYSADQFLKMYENYGGKIQGKQTGGAVNMKSSNISQSTIKKSQEQFLEKLGGGDPIIIPVPMGGQSGPSPMAFSGASGGQDTPPALSSQPSNNVALDTAFRFSLGASFG